MKRQLVLLFSCFVSTISFSQDWIRYYGTGQDSYGNYCIQHYDKGFVLGGGIGNYGWIIKTDVNGNVLWDIKIGDDVHLTGIDAVENTDDNGLILCGTTRMANPPHSDPFIMKLNACSEVEWCKFLVYDNTGDGGQSVKPTSDGGFVLLGLFFGNDPDDRIRLIKFDGGGDVCWVKIYNRDSIIRNEDVRKLIVDSANFLITGFCYYPGWIKPYFIQTDTSGNENWRLAYSQHTGLGYVGEAWETFKDYHGNYYAAGRRETKPELLKFSSEGYELMNVDIFPTAINGDTRTILQYSDTSIIIVAGWDIGSGFNTGILKIDTLGNQKICKILQVGETSIPGHTAKTIDGKILFLSNYPDGSYYKMTLMKFNPNLQYDSVYSGQYRYDTLCPDTIHSRVIYPFCDIVVGIDDPVTDSKKGILKVFPNPATNQVTVEFPENIVVRNQIPFFGSTTIYRKWKSTILQVYNNNGIIIYQKEVIRAEKELQIDVSSWPKGIYYFKLSFNEQKVSDRKVVIK